MPVYETEVRAARVVEGVRFGANDRPFWLRSVVDGNVHICRDDGYEKQNPGRPKSGRAQIQRMLRKTAPDGGRLFYTVDASAKEPWVNSDGNAFQPPDPAMLLDPWGPEEDKRHAALGAEHEARKKSLAGEHYRPASTTANQLTANLAKTAAAATDATAASAPARRARKG